MKKIIGRIMVKALSSFMLSYFEDELIIYKNKFENADEKHKKVLIPIIKYIELQIKRLKSAK